MNCEMLQNPDWIEPIPADFTASPGQLAQLDAALNDRATAFARKVGARHFSYFATRMPRRSSVRIGETLRCSYPMPWVDRYLGRTYHFYDPVICLGRQARLPFRWGHGRFLSDFVKAQRLVFHEAKEFEITEGYAVPVHGPEGDGGVFSICAPRRADIDDALAAAAPHIQLFAVQFHDAMMRRFAARDDTDMVELTERETEILHWTADGLTTEAIADRLGLTASAINYHLGNVCRKLGAASKHHAAILAIRAGII